MKKILFALLIVLMAVVLIVSCESDPETKYVPVDINEYMLKIGCEINPYTDPVELKYWCDDLPINVTSITSITFTKDKPGSITATGTDITFEGTGKVLGYVSGTDVYIVGDKILGNYDCGGMFYNFTALESINFDNFDTKKIKKTYFMDSEGDCRGMFERCERLEKLCLSGWDTSNFTDMCCMFFECSSLTDIKGIENFNTSNIVNMFSTFLECKSIQKLSLTNWDTSNVVNMEDMFHDCSSLTDLDLTSFNIKTNSDRPQLSTVGMFEDICPSIKVYVKPTDVQEWLNRFHWTSGTDSKGTYITRNH